MSYIIDILFILYKLGDKSVPKPPAPRRPCTNTAWRQNFQRFKGRAKQRAKTASPNCRVPTRVNV